MTADSDRQAAEIRAIRSAGLKALAQIEITNKFISDKPVEWRYVSTAGRRAFIYPSDDDDPELSLQVSRNGFDIKQPYNQNHIYQFRTDSTLLASKAVTRGAISRTVADQ